jgi:hypothetical protein
MIIALGLFVVSALTGLFLAVQHFRGQALSFAVALAHGAFAASGLLALGWVLAHTAFTGKPALAAGLFVAAALGGFYLFANHLRGRRLPTPVVVIHAAAAVTGFLILAAAVLHLA